VIQKVAVKVARAFGDIEVKGVTPPTCAGILLTAHQVVIVATHASIRPVARLSEILCADISHRQQVGDVEVLRSRDRECCLVPNVAAGDVDMRIAGPSAFRGKVAPPLETQLDV
jgi:hypothetical protein